jgi:small GTP-binding protein
LLEKPVKIVLVGDPFVGKSSLIQSYALDEFSTLYIPTSHDSYKCGEITRSGGSGTQTFSAVLMDVSSQEDYARMRESIYKTVDVFIFCFSLSNIELSAHIFGKDQAKSDRNNRKKGSSSHISLGNIKTVWLPEVDKALGKEP